MLSQPLLPGIAKRSWVFLTVLGILSAFAPMSVDMYLPAMPGMVEKLQASPATVQWTLSAFMLGFGIGQVIYGPLSDRFGRRPVLLAGVLFYTLASILCANAETVGTLILWRFVQAIGACSGQVIGRAVVRDLYDRDRAARMLSIMVLLMGAAPLLAPIVGGQILRYADWRTIFWVLTGFGVISLLAVTLLLGETLPRDRRVRFTSAQMLGSFVTILRHRRFLGYVSSSTLIYAAMFAYLAGSPFVFISVYGVPTQYYGFFFGTNVIGLMGGALINSRIVVRVGSETILKAGTLSCALVGIGLAVVTATGWGGMWGVAALLFCYIASLSFIGANSMAGGLALFPQLAGTASALFGMLQFTFGCLAGALVGWLFNGTALPMGLVMAVCAVSGFIAHRLFIAR